MPLAVKCPSCGRENRPGASFCEQCGERLSVACPKCAAQVRPGASFCDSCGTRVAIDPAAVPEPVSYTPPHLAEKILRQRSALEGERRMVSVLFCDAQGFTPLSDGLDPEAVYSAMQGFLATMLEVVHRHEGTVNQFLGDGIMALFGAPVAHEDAARRAVAAGLEIQDELKASGSSIRFRIGINSGQVVIGKIGDNLRMDYTAVGDTTNLAARLQTLAAAGAVYIGESTYRQVRDYFRCENLGELEIKGKAVPVPAYRVISSRGPRTRIQAAVERGLTPLVGRDSELAALHSLLEKTRKGRGQLVLLSGEAGVGKSRLLHEFRHSVADAGVVWLEGQCSSVGRRIPYLPIVDALKRSFRIEEGEGEAEIIDRLERASEAWPAERRASIPYVRFLFSLDPGDEAVKTMDPQLRRAAIFGALRQLVADQARERPAILVIEDMHWVDEQSEEALSALMDAMGEAPLMLLQTARLEYQSPLRQRSFFSQLSLTSLSQGETTAMSQALLGDNSLDDSVRDLIVSRSDGNPFYVEEVTKALLESGALHRTGSGYELRGPIRDLTIPDSIQGVIMSRIDRLDEEPRRAIQLASVIGREFTVQLLHRISDRDSQLEGTLAILKSLELIYEKSFFPELAYMFKHALTHDVAYSSLLVERRRTLHRLVAAATEELFADRIAEHYEMIAHHYFEGEAWEPALQYLVKAGDKAASTFSNQDALEFYQQALELAERLEDGDLTVQVGFKRAVVNFTLLAIPEALADVDRVMKVAIAREDLSLRATALAYRGFLLHFAHDFEAAEAVLREAINLCDESGAEDGRFVAKFTLFTMLYVLDRWAEAELLRPELEELATSSNNPIALGFWHWFSPIIENWQGNYAKAVETVRQRRRILTEKGLLIAVSDLEGRWMEGLALGGLGRYTEAMAVLSATISECERIGDRWSRARATNTLGWVYNELCAFERGLQLNRLGLQLGEQVGDMELIANAALNIGDSLLAMGQWKAAEEHLTRIEKVVDHPLPQHRWMLWRYSQHLHHSLGELRLSQGDAALALAYAERCLAAAGRTRSPRNLAKGHRLMAKTLLALGRPEAAETEIGKAIQVARDIDNPVQLWRTLVAAAEIDLAGGRPATAAAEAMTVIEEVAAGLDEELSRTLLSSAPVAAARAMASSA